MDTDQETWHRISEENARTARTHCQQLRHAAVIQHELLQELLWENPVDPIRCGGTTFGRRKHKRRRTEMGHDRIMDDYFDLMDPVYDEQDFCQRF